MKSNRMVRETVVPTPVGAVHALSTDGVVLALGFEEGWRRRAARRIAEWPGAQRIDESDPVVATALRAYVSGDVGALDRLDVDQNGSDFHVRVWDALRRIPAGRTDTYGALAKRLGVPDGARAVGRAAAENAVALVVPCHRLVGARGELTGFAHGIERKRWLLELEGALAVQPSFPGRAIA